MINIMSAGEDGTICTWDAATLSRSSTVKADNGIFLTSASLHPDRTRVITSRKDSALRVSSRSGSVDSAMIMDGHNGFVNSACYSSDGSRALSASVDNTARIWDASTGECLLTCLGHGDAVHDASFSANGRRFVTASADRTARIWDASTGECLLTCLGHDDVVSSACFSPNGSHVVSSSWDTSLCVWECI